MTSKARPLTAGKFRGLTNLADRKGIFKMIAVDQRPPIFNALAAHGKRTPSEVRDDEVSNVKVLLTRVLAPEASAILIDPVWTHPYALSHIPGDVGLLSTLEGYDFDLIADERRSRAIEDWSVAKIKRSGGAGVKVLAWHRPDISAETQAHQDAFITDIGESCQALDIPFVLELLIYPKPGEDPDSADYARAKPERVLASVAHYAQERFKVDLLKLEFPVDLKYCAEFAAGAFDGSSREAVYNLAEVKSYTQRLGQLSHVPWVLLSAGVGPREFALNLELAFEAGASGFLAGRAVWMSALDAYPDLSAIEKRLRASSVPYLHQIAALAERAAPWTRHPRYGGAVEVADAGEGWHRRYGA